MNKLSIGDAWTETAAFLRAERRMVAPLALALLALPATILTLVMPGENSGSAGSLFQQPPPGPWIIVALAAFSIMLVGQLAISRLALGWHGTLADALRHGARRILPMFGANLLLTVIVVIPLVVILAVIQLAIMAATNLAAPAAANAALFLVAIPLLALFGRASLSLPVSAGTNIGPIRILRRAFSISRGASVRILGFVLLFIFAAAIVASASAAVIGSLVITLLGQPHPWTVSAMLLALSAGLIQALIIAMWSVMLSRIYAQLAIVPAAF